MLYTTIQKFGVGKNDKKYINIVVKIIVKHYYSLK